MPLLVKGITTPDAARIALEHGVEGLIVSHYRGLPASDSGAAVVALPAIVDAVGGRVPVLADGSFRRGTDILKALALGARAVLVGRPVMWGLAAYGAEGCAASSRCCRPSWPAIWRCAGKSNLQMLDRSMLRVHAARRGAGAT